jgi:hypothetical protein
MGHIEHICGDIVDPVIHAGLTARGTETGFAGEGDAMLILATGTKITGIATLRVTAEHLTLNNVPDVSLLIEGDFIGQVEVAVALPVVKEDLAEAVVPGWVVERPGREGLILKGRWVFDGEVFQDIAGRAKKCNNYHVNGRQV